MYMMDRKPMLLPCQISIFWDFLLIVKPQENLLWRTVWSLYNEQKIVSLENVRNVLFQALLLDNVTVENGLFHAQMCTVMLLK